MESLLLCGAPRLLLCGGPSVSLCGEPQPIGADVPILNCGAPPIMLCIELQPLGAELPLLIRGAEAPSAKGLLNPGDDAQHSVVHRVALTGCGACSFTSSRRLMAEAALR